MPSLAAEPVKIGVSVPLTGEAATYGVDIRNSLEFANEKLGGGAYQLVIEDDKCTGKDAVSVAHKLVNIDKVQHVLGFGCSGSLLAAAPVYEKAKRVVVAAATSSAAISKAGDYIFRTCISDVLTAEMLFGLVASRHTRFAILSEETEYSQTLLNAFRDQNRGQKLILVSDSFVPGTRDFRSLLLRLRSENPQGLFLNTQAEKSLTVIVKQIAEMKWDVPLYAVYWPSSPSFLEMAAPEAEGMLYVDLPGVDEIATPLGKKWFQEFTQQYGAMRSSDLFFYLSVASFSVLHQSVQDGRDVRSALYRNSFNTIMGPLSFDQNGDVQGYSPVLRVIRKGKPEPFVAESLNNRPN